MFYRLKCGPGVLERAHKDVLQAINQPSVDTAIGNYDKSLDTPSVSPEYGDPGSSASTYTPGYDPQTMVVHAHSSWTASPLQDAGQVAPMVQGFIPKPSSIQYSEYPSLPAGYIAPSTRFTAAEGQSLPPNAFEYKRPVTPVGGTHTKTWSSTPTVTPYPGNAAPSSSAAVKSRPYPSNALAYSSGAGTRRPEDCKPDIRIGTEKFASQLAWEQSHYPKHQKKSKPVKYRSIDLDDKTDGLSETSLREDLQARNLWVPDMMQKVIISQGKNNSGLKVHYFWNQVEYTAAFQNKDLSWRMYNCYNTAPDPPRTLDTDTAGYQASAPGTE